MNPTVEQLAALGHATRLSAFELLAGKDSIGLSVGEIAVRLKVSAALASNHLQILARAGLITQERDGKSTICRADLGAAAELGAFICSLDRR